MKPTSSLLIVILFFILIASKCKKDPVTNVGSLPPATQTGANTLGFLLNGVPWTPQGYNGTANLSTSVDFGYHKGVFNISAYRIITAGNSESFAIFSDSLNYMTIPITISLVKNSPAGIYFSNKNCFFFYSDTSVTRTGSLTISKLDKTNHIISGTFNATLSQSGCGTIQITDGRFDMSF